MAQFQFRLNHAALKRLDQAAVRALEMTGEAIHTDVVQSETIPRKTGRLQNEAFSVDVSRSAAGHVELVQEGPYARRLYFHPEYNFHREPWEKRDKDGKLIDKGDGNPNAGAGWFEPYLSGGQREAFAQKAFARFYKREAEV